MRQGRAAGAAAKLGQATGGLRQVLGVLRQEPSATPSSKALRPGQSNNLFENSTPYPASFFGFACLRRMSYQSFKRPLKSVRQASAQACLGTAALLQNVTDYQNIKRCKPQAQAVCRIMPMMGILAISGSAVQ
jgi:hypothetical protein